MIRSIQNLVRELRDSGVPVSVAEVLEASAVLQAVGVGDRERVRLALRATLVKSALQQPLFDRLFDLHFHVPWPAGEASERKRKRRRRGSPSGDPARRAGAKGGGRSRQPSLRPSPQPRRSEHPRTRGERPRTRGTPQPGAPREDRRRLGRKRTRPPLGQAPQRTERRGRGRALLKQASSAAARERAVSRGRLRFEADRARRAEPLLQPLDRRMTRADEALIAREIERLGRELRTRHGRRFRHARHGRVDMRATLAASARSGGVPFRLARRVRRLAHPRLLVLCDVSGSVIRTSRFLLRLLHETHRLFDRTDGFVFVDRPIPAGALFAGVDFDAWLDELPRLPGLDPYAYSDFGNVFLRLLADHGDLLTRRTSLLVLGDARSNRLDPHPDALAAIADRIAHVVWLNPERAGQWYTGDSCLRAYEPYLDHLLPAETAADLALGVDALCRAARHGR